MARRVTKAQAGLVGLLLLIGIPLALIAKFVETFGVVVPAVLVVILVAGAIFLKAFAKSSRLNALKAKYGDPEVVERIINKTVWVGETAEQLVDSLGHPADVDEKRLKTKSKSIWKYAHQGGKRYGFRVTVENGVVVGWDEKL